MLPACVAYVRYVRKTGLILERPPKKVEPSSGHARPRIDAIATLRRQIRMRETPASTEWIIRDPFRDKKNGKYRLFFFTKRFKISSNLPQ